MTDDESKVQALPEPSPVEHGGRVELRLITAPSDESPSAHYGARWFTASQKIEGLVTIALSDKPVVSLEASEPLPEWLGTFTTTLVRTTARQAVKENTWPRRLTRWRAAPSSPKNS